MKVQLRSRAMLAGTAVVTVLALAACGGSSSGSPAEPSDGNDNGSIDAPDKITVWSYFSTPPQMEYQEKAAALFNAEYPDVEVEYVNIPFEELDSKLLAAASAGDGPDVVINNPAVDFQPLEAAGALADLSPYMADLGDPFPYPDSVLWKDASGAVKTIQSYVNLLGLWYNKTLLEEHGLEPPTTLEEMENVMQTVSEAGGEGLLMSASPGVDGAWSWYPFLAGQGVDFCTLDNPKTADVLEMIDGWADKGWMPAGYQEMTNVQTPNMFLGGDVALYINGNWNLGLFEAEADFEFGAVPLPAGPEGTHILLGGEGQAIGGYSKHPDMAWEYLKLAWLDEEAQKLSLDVMGSIITMTSMEDQVAEAPYLSGFLAQVADAGAWPDNENQLTAITNFGNTISGFAAGQYSAAEAAQKLADDMARDLGDGGC